VAFFNFELWDARDPRGGQSQPRARRPNAESLVSRRVRKLAEHATRERLKRGAPAALVEATAALQDLSVRLDPASLGELERLQAKLTASITVAPNGPYLATNVPNVADLLGGPVPARPQLALCRCGRSKLKPLCDGSHADAGFSGQKGSTSGPRPP
jgi:CDGSH-type Zn-finger protein